AEFVRTPGEAPRVFSSFDFRVGAFVGWDWPAQNSVLRADSLDASLVPPCPGRPLVVLHLGGRHEGSPPCRLARQERKFDRLSAEQSLPPPPCRLARQERKFDRLSAEQSLPPPPCRLARQERKFDRLSAEQ